MAIIDITCEAYSDVTYTRTITARQLVELPANEIVAIKVVDRDDPSHTVWVRIDEIEPMSTMVVVSYNDGWAGSVNTDQYFRLNDKIEIAMVG